MAARPIRVLHVSDVHVDVPVRELPLRELHGKRVLGLTNLLLRRHEWFRDAREKLAALARFCDTHAVDLVICTGDYTALGTEPELRAARAAIEGLTKRPLGFVTVPGNHDLYMPDCVADRRFIRVFGDLLGSDWPEHAADDGWPAVRLYAEHLAVVCVNSARPNPQLWRSSGRIPDRQLTALRAVLEDPRLAARTLLIATHYAPRRADGSPDRFTHGLENADALLALCEHRAHCAILHGHIHRRYHVPRPDGPSLFGAGSATHRGREGLWFFEIEPGRAQAVPGTFHDREYRLLPSERVSF